MQDIAGGWSASALRCFTWGRAGDDPPALPGIVSGVRSRYVKGLPFHLSGRAGSVDGVYCRTRNAGFILLEPQRCIRQSTGMAQWL